MSEHLVEWVAEGGRRRHVAAWRDGQSEAELLALNGPEPGIDWEEGPACHPGCHAEATRILAKNLQLRQAAEGPDAPL